MCHPFIASHKKKIMKTHSLKKSRIITRLPLPSTLPPEERWEAFPLFHSGMFLFSGPVQAQNLLCDLEHLLLLLLTSNFHKSRILLHRSTFYKPCKAWTTLVSCIQNLNMAPIMYFWFYTRALQSIRHLLLVEVWFPGSSLCWWSPIISILGHFFCPPECLLVVFAVVSSLSQTSNF